MFRLCVLVLVGSVVVASVVRAETAEAETSKGEPKPACGLDLPACHNARAHTTHFFHEP